MARKPGFVDRLMAERVNYGGELIARGALCRRMLTEGHDPRAADYFAFAQRSVSDEEAEEYRAACACGARWLSVFDHRIETCPTCEKKEAANQ